MITIAIAEDSKPLREVLKQKLEFHKEFDVVLTTENGQALIDQLDQGVEVDIIIMDLNMPVLGGIDATRIVKKKYTNIKVVVLTIFDNDDHIFEAIMAGANGYLLKDESAENIHKLIIDVSKGGSVMSPTIAFKTLELLKGRHETTDSKGNHEHLNLSPREIEVLEKLSEGFSYKIAGEHLFISTGTVRKHVENIYKKLQVTNKVDAIRKAQKSRLI